MRLVLAVRRIALLGLAAFAGTAIADDAPDTDNLVRQKTVTQLIANLNADRPADRADALDRLINLGRAGRVACRRALATATPQQRVGIDLVLLKEPFTHGDYPAAVMQGFENYPILSSDQREEQLVRCLRSAGIEALPAWMRVVRQDPSPAVRWEAARYIRYYLEDDPETARRLVELTADVGIRPVEFDPESPDCRPVDQNFPLLAVAGFAQVDTNADRANLLINRAIEAERDCPTACRGQADFVYAWLIFQAEHRRDSKAVVSLYRQQAANTEITAEGSAEEAVSSLIATQCAFGPFPGFADDLRRYQDDLTSPRVLYSLATLADRRQEPTVAAGIRRLAMWSGGDSIPDHFRVGLFLARQHWDDDAEQEMNRCLALPNVNRFTIDWALKNVAIDRDDDLAAGKYLEDALAAAPDARSIEMTDALGKPMPWDADAAWAQVHCHYMRAARDAGDVETVRQRLDKWLAIDIDKHLMAQNPTMAADVVPALNMVDRKADADRMFEVAYQLLQARVKRSPADAMPKNNLAWLLVESGRHLDEATQLANASAEAYPYDADVLDTQAEVLFATGHKKEAAEVEARAAGYKPQSKMIAIKAERFRKAAAN